MQFSKSFRGKLLFPVFTNEQTEEMQQGTMATVNLTAVPGLPLAFPKLPKTLQRVLRYHGNSKRNPEQCERGDDARLSGTIGGP